MVRILLLMLALAVCSGCATHGQERHFERNPALDASTKIEATDPHLATVYLIRPKAFAQAIIYTPIPPIYYAVDGRLVAIMPLGTFVRLKMAPGPHTFSLLRYFPGSVLSDPKIAQSDVTLSVEAGRRYYVSEAIGFVSAAFKQLDDVQGAAELSDVELAKILYAPATVAGFKSRLLTKPTDQQSSVRTSLESALPSQKQVSDFFEGLATVALVALLVVGIAMGADLQGGGAPRPPERSPVLTPPPYYQQQGPNRWSVRTSSGVTSEISAFGSETRLRNWSTGVTYTIDGDRIRGSDGSRYRVVGSSIISDTGEHFQKIGNAIFGSDGRSCNVIGAQLICSPGR